MWKALLIGSLLLTLSVEDNGVGISLDGKKQFSDSMGMKVKLSFPG
jgi:hypothetical protein